MPELVGGKSVSGELVEAIKVNEGIWGNLYLIELVKVGTGGVEVFAGGQRLLNVCPDLRQGVVVTKVLCALTEVVNGSNISAPVRLLEAPTWLT